MFKLKYVSWKLWMPVDLEMMKFKLDVLFNNGNSLLKVKKKQIKQLIN